MASASSTREWSRVVWLAVALFFIITTVRNYVARKHDEKAVALQIERLKSQVNIPHLTEIDARNIADTKLSDLELKIYRLNIAFYVSRTQAWYVSYARKSNGSTNRYTSKSISVWVDDTTRYVSRSD